MQVRRRNQSWHEDTPKRPPLPSLGEDPSCGEGHSGQSGSPSSFTAGRSVGRMFLAAVGWLPYPLPFPVQWGFLSPTCRYTGRAFVVWSDRPGRLLRVDRILVSLPVRIRRMARKSGSMDPRAV